MRDALLLLVVFGSIPFIFVRPHIGVLMWCWIAYMVPHKLAWGFAQNFQFAQIIGIVTIVAWVISREPKRLPLDRIVVLLITLLAWVSITTVFAIVPDQALWDWDRATKVLIFTFLMIIVMQDLQRINQMIWVIVGSLGFYGVKGGIFILAGGVGRVYGPNSGFFSENNAMGLVLVMVVPLMWYLQSISKKFYVTWGLRVAMALSMVAVIGTFSRGAMLAGACMVAFLILKSNKRALLIAGVIAGVIVVTPIIPQEWFNRMESIKTYEEDESAMGRIRAWTFAVKLALDRPFVGGGFEVNADRELFMSYVPEAVGNRTFHSSYFQMLGEHGFPGLAVFLLLGVVTFFTGSWIAGRSKGKEDLYWANSLGKMLQVSLVGYAVGALFLDMAIIDLYYNLIALMLLTKLVILKEAGTTVPDASHDAVPHDPRRSHRRHEPRPRIPTPQATLKTAFPSRLTLLKQEAAETRPSYRQEASSRRTPAKQA